MSIEFKATVNNGMIEIPEEYRDRLQGNVRVIVVAEEKQTPVANLIQELIEQPLQIPDFRPLTRDDIYSRD